ncbi:M48 family metalloprotease [Novosphingobium sp. YJ-S2-02]|uniref:M48 family metalloprotease n=1 Tax=Novosphingobium aureum TaxID=2792964 RepID=A0A931MMD9_9SPHN|nr:M48 family metallopeptidase [Novosphingobium aureum]MBH0114339.1 M48 family metalloprotease [Novosphingobium aureum]
MSVDYIGAYAPGDREAVKQLLGMTDLPQVAAVARGSPATLAGVRAGDTIVSINAVSTKQLIEESDEPSLFADELEQHLRVLPSDSPIELVLEREGHDITVTITPEAACAPRYILKTDKGIAAFTDGANIAVSSRLIDFAQNDDEIALVAGHELAHVVYGDDEASGLGQRRFWEDRADLLGLRIAHCAGYDVDKGLAYWTRRDAKDWLRLFRDPTHRSRGARVKRMREELASLSCPPALPDMTGDEG